MEVIQTKSTNNLPYTNTDGFKYENDTIQIKYAFWNAYGTIGMSIYNKLNKPIYIDWGNSAFIDNGNTINFWTDETQSVANTKSVGIGRYNNNTAVGVSKSQTSTTIYKPRRIMCIPPKSQITDVSFQISNSPIPIGTYDYSSTPIKFRSYLVLSTDQDIKTQFYVDEEFYISDTKYIDGAKFSDGQGSSLFKRPDWFYIENIKGTTGMDPYKVYGDPSWGHRTAR